MVKYNLALEIGGANTVLYKLGNGIVLKEPSLVAVDVRDKKRQVREVGKKAKNLLGKTSSAVEIACPVDRGIITSQELAMLMLKEFLTKIQEKGVVKQKYKALICVPCGLDEQEKLEYKRLGYGVGFTEVSLVPSPICACLGMGVDYNDIKSHMLIDFGKSTTDIAIINSCHIVNGITLNIGGQDLDQAISSYVKTKYNVALSGKTCEEIKNEVASLLNNDTRSIVVNGINLSTNNHIELVLFSKELLPIVHQFFDGIAYAAEAVLNKASSEVVADINSCGIYLCGGLSQIIGLEKFLQQRTNLPVYVDIDANNSVINGAGMILNSPNLIDIVKF